MVHILMKDSSTHLGEDRETDSSRGIDIGVEKGRNELALGGLGRIVLGEDHAEFVHTALPVGIGHSRDACFPFPIR
jgi:hypothetical protein